MPTHTIFSAAAVAISGILYGLSFPTTSFLPMSPRPLAWVALVPALVVVAGASPRGAFVWGALLAWVGACLTVYWLPVAAVNFYQQSLLAGGMLFIAVTTVMVVPYVAAWTWFHRRVAVRWRPWTPVLSAMAFVAGEYWRSRILGGNPWAVFGYTQPSASAIAQIAEATGVYGVSFVLVVVNATIAGLARPAGRGWATPVVGAAVLAASLGYGAWARATTAAPAPAPGARFRVGIVQGNLDLGTQWRPELYGRNLELYLTPTREILVAAQPDLVVWPETAMTFFVDREATYRASIASYFQGYDAELLSGGARYEGDSDPQFFNSVFVLSADGSVRDHYDKEKLLPFAERFPFGGELLRRNFGRVREFSAGTEVEPVQTALGKVGIVICNEAMYPEIARRRVLDGAEILANLSNDSWVGDEGYSRMAFDMAAFRAVENRRTLIRASTAGPSAVIDSQGRAVAETAVFASTTLVAPVSPSSRRTPYSRFGDLFAQVCSVVALAALLLTRRRV